MYDTDIEKIREGMHEKMKGTLNNLEIRLNSPHQKIEFIGALSEYSVQRKEAIPYIGMNKIRKYDQRAIEIFEKFATKTIERMGKNEK